MEDQLQPFRLALEGSQRETRRTKNRPTLGADSSPLGMDWSDLVNVCPSTYFWPSKTWGKRKTFCRCLFHRHKSCVRTYLARPEKHVFVHYLLLLSDSDASFV